MRSGATVTAGSGELTIHADSITIENAASISVAPTGASPGGAGGAGGRYHSAGGGGYGSRGGGSYPGATWGSSTNAVVHPGSPGGDGAPYSGAPTTGTGGRGGGVVRLIADTIDIAGQLTANGQNGTGSDYSGAGGGSGGGILIAGDSVTIAGTVSAIGGGGVDSSRDGGAGGNGRVKILYGSEIDDSMATISGTVTRGVLPPIAVSSGTHPDQIRVYNDGFPVVGMSWARPFDPITGYYWAHSSNESLVPSPANAEFVGSEIVSFNTEDLRQGFNYFLISSVTPTAEVGTVAGAFVIQLNRTPPTLSSSSHSSSNTWTMNPNVFMSWTYPHGEENYQGVYYVFDHYGDTVPTTTDTFVSVDQLQVLLSGIADGAWMFHVVSVDTQGYLTREARHYRVLIGEDPGAGTVFGQVTDSSTSMPIPGATVSVNRGLWPDETTNGTGNFNFAAVANGTWELKGPRRGLRRRDDEHHRDGRDEHGRERDPDADPARALSRSQVPTLARVRVCARTGRCPGPSR